MKEFGKVFLIMFVSLVAIIAFAGNLNAVSANGLDNFYGWGAGINFIVEIYLIWNLYKRLFKKDE